MLCSEKAGSGGKGNENEQVESSPATDCAVL